MSIRRSQARHSTLLLLLLVQFFLPVCAKALEVDSVIASAKGHGVISSALEERKFTGALAVLRQDGTLTITLYSDLQLQAQGTWSASNSSPEEILLKITGEANCSATGTGTLLLSKDRKFIKELTINGKLFDGREIVVTFVADGPEDGQKGYEPGDTVDGCVPPTQQCPQGSIMTATFFKLRF